MVAMVRAWEKSDELMGRLIVSPEDAARINLRGHVRELVSEMEPISKRSFSGLHEHFSTSV